ncbi:YkgJ family cysteine cluster protein [Marinomonas balearica]|uniref:Uncharacterized protein n=1 Tax=Marinomonas balearica TaxID=491947 RepID=A0A4R6MDQ5_9GAMM|nr:YkgJ family cysteine cluster protein [Marinomonas balearica]TDO99868.1 hypothetical protein DFP79_0877 [Marinomonas balearica]
MNCRPSCGACCTAPSITSPIPGMPNGKPAGVPCLHLMEDRRCAIFNEPTRPKVCSDFAATHDFCGESTEEAMNILALMESETNPNNRTQSRIK